MCDPQAGVTHYKISNMGAASTTSTAIADGSLRHDLASLAPGSYNIGVAACSGETGTVWEACSTESPFQFVKPNLIAPMIPGNLKLTK